MSTAQKHNGQNFKHDRPGPNVCVLLGITCGDPGVPVNGSVTSNGTFITSTAEFICDFVFELIGDTQRVCQPDGTWSNMVPECRRKLLAVKL